MGDLNTVEKIEEGNDCLYSEKYFEESEIGYGLCGTVHRVKRKKDGKLFAAKKIKIDQMNLSV